MGFGKCLVGLALCVALAASDAMGQTTARPTLDVRVLDRFGVPSDTLKEGLGVAGRIFAASDVTVNWIAGEAHGERYLMVSLTDKPIGAAVANHQVLGVALGSLEGKGRFAWVFYDRVKALAQSLDISTPQLLGHVIAHELGHLLLSYGSHSHAGLMRGGFDKRQARLASQGALLFAKNEGIRIRERLAAGR